MSIHHLFVSSERLLMSALQRLSQVPRLAGNILNILFTIRPVL